MKFDRNKTFPYPVLRPFSDDYIDIEFQTTVEFQDIDDVVSTKISFVISSEEILKEIQKGTAKFVAVVSCRETYFSQALTSDAGEITASFEDGALRGEVRVSPYVVAVSNIAGFKSPDINPEFGEGPFSFSKGDVLAQDETQVVFIDRNLFKPVTSVFDLVKNDALSGGEWMVGLDENHVQVEVSSKMKESIDNARNNNAHKVVIINSILFAAVIHAIQKLKENKAAYEDRKWAEVINRQLHNNGWDLESNEAHVLAQRLMKYPLQLLDTYVFGEKS